MIVKRASVALRLTDGFTGKALTGSQVQAAVDGEPFPCVVKEDGWFVFVDLPGGDRAISLSGAGFLPQEFITAVSPDSTAEAHRAMMPAPGYPFGRPVPTYSLLFKRGKQPASGVAFYVPAPGRAGAVRVAQDDAGKGSLTLRLFTQRKPALLPLPGDFLLGDGDGAEIIRLLPGDGGVYPLEAPLRRAHKRGSSAQYVRRHEADAEGYAFVAAEDAPLLVYADTGKSLARYEAQPGGEGHTVVNLSESSKK